MYGRYPWTSFPGASRGVVVLRKESLRGSTTVLSPFCRGGEGRVSSVLVGSVLFGSLLYPPPVSVEGD